MAAKKTTPSTMTRFDQMAKSLPLCMAGWDHLAYTTEEDLEYLVQIELDLTEEGQDGTSRRNLKPLRNWLKKWDLTRT